MTAGPHTIAATFVARTMAESDAVLQPFVPGGGEVGIIEGEESPLNSAARDHRPVHRPSGISETPSRERIFTCWPQATADELPCAREILTRLTRQAFRRPVTDADLEIPPAFYEQGRASGDFEAGVRNALMIVLATPEFWIGSPRRPRIRHRARSTPSTNMVSLRGFVLPLEQLARR